MHYDDLFWDFFEKSGSIEAYLGYKKCKNGDGFLKYQTENKNMNEL